MPPVEPNGVIQLEPIEVLARWTKQKNNYSVTELLIKWAEQTADDASWEEFF